jgi:hypothetical protein
LPDIFEICLKYAHVNDIIVINHAVIVSTFRREQSGEGHMRALGVVGFLGLSVAVASADTVPTAATLDRTSKVAEIDLLTAIMSQRSRFARAGCGATYSRYVPSPAVAPCPKVCEQ